MNFALNVIHSVFHRPVLLLYGAILQQKMTIQQKMSILSEAFVSIGLIPGLTCVSDCWSKTLQCDFATRSARSTARAMVRVFSWSSLNFRLIFDCFSADFGCFLSGSGYFSAPPRTLPPPVCIYNDEFCITNDGSCITNDGFCIENDGPRPAQQPIDLPSQNRFVSFA